MGCNVFPTKMWKEFIYKKQKIICFQNKKTYESTLFLKNKNIFKGFQKTSYALKWQSEILL